MDWTTTQKRLAADTDNWGAIAKAVGLPRMTIARIGTGETPSPRIDTAQKIADYYAIHDLETRRGKAAEAPSSAPDPSPSRAIA